MAIEPARFTDLHLNIWAQNQVRSARQFTKECRPYQEVKSRTFRVVRRASPLHLSLGEWGCLSREVDRLGHFAASSNSGCSVSLELRSN